MRCFEVDRRGPVVIEGGFPAGHANTPAISRFQPGESPFRPGRDQIVAIEHGKIEELARHQHANGMQAGVLRSGPAISVAIKPGQGIAAAALQFGSENVGGHEGN